jgi:hypothetical protein
MGKSLYLSVEVIKLHSFGRSLVLLAVSVLLLVPAFGAVKRFVPPVPEQIEKELMDMINRDRQALGRRPLLPDPLLQEIARSHSAKMAAEGKLSHTFPGWPAPEQKLSLAGACFLRSSENVAYSQTPFARFIHESLMNSILHKINILEERMRQAGIGVCKKGNDYYISEEFADIIDCPEAGEVTAFMENHLRQWYMEKFGLTLALSSEAKPWARVSAQQNLAGNPIALAPFTDRKLQVIGVSFNELDPILAELKKEIKSNGIKSFAVGVAWGRTTGFPGGTYAVSLVLFE